MSDYQKAASSVAGELADCLTGVSAEQVERTVQVIDSAERLFLAGAGRSALAVRGFAMRLMHLGKAVHMVGDATTPGIGKGDLLIIGSGSGKTASLLNAATTAHKLGATIVLVTIDPASPIGQLADVVVQVPAPSPKAAGGGASQSVQPMGSLFEQSMFVLFDVVVMLLMARTGITSDQMFTRHANIE